MSRALLYFDRAGEPIDEAEWIRLYALPFADYRQVERTELGSVMVSTVWLGIGLAPDPESGKPLIFETMVFRDGESVDELPMWRWATEGQARAGHAEICSGVLRNADALIAALERDARDDH